MRQTEERRHGPSSLLVLSAAQMVLLDVSRPSARGLASSHSPALIWVSRAPLTRYPPKRTRSPSTPPCSPTTRSPLALLSHAGTLLPVLPSHAQPSHAHTLSSHALPPTPALSSYALPSHAHALSSYVLSSTRTRSYPTCSYPMRSPPCALILTHVLSSQLTRFPLVLPHARSSPLPRVLSRYLL